MMLSVQSLRLPQLVKDDARSTKHGHDPIVVHASLFHDRGETIQRNLVAGCG